jgi:hypothetical protein
LAITCARGCGVAIGQNDIPSFVNDLMKAIRDLN